MKLDRNATGLCRPEVYPSQPHHVLDVNAVHYLGALIVGARAPE